jgi:hypothetical protein
MTETFGTTSSCRERITPLNGRDSPDCRTDDAGASEVEVEEASRADCADAIEGRQRSDKLRMMIDDLRMMQLRVG